MHRWEEVLSDAGESEPGPGWRSLLSWFREQEKETLDTVTSAVFVRVYDDHKSQVPRPEGTEMVGSVFPRLAVGLTAAGSLVGVFGHVVQT